MEATAKQHPLALDTGNMPHDLDRESFEAWLKRNTMTENVYWLRIGADQDLTASYGKPVLTSALTNDQRGWAKERFLAHYYTNGARWWIRPEKSSVPIPAISQTTTPKRRRRHS